MAGWSDRVMEKRYTTTNNQVVSSDNVECVVVSRTKKPYVAKNLEEANRFKKWFESVFDNAYYEECKIYRLVTEEK